MLVVGLTGRSGSGKTTVSKYYAGKGFPVVDGDAVSRLVTVKGSACLDELVAAFGDSILCEDGSLNRKRLGEIVFGSAEKNEELVGITHPYILRYFQEQAQVAKANGARLMFLDGAMIVGGPTQVMCDKIIVVTSEEKLAISRIILRDGISKTAANLRLAAQLDDATLRAAADYLIENNGSEAQLLRKADEALNSLLADA